MNTEDTQRPWTSCPCCGGSGKVKGASKADLRRMRRVNWIFAVLTVIAFGFVIWYAIPVWRLLWPRH